jgi:glycolate oxidase
VTADSKRRSIARKLRQRLAGEIHADEKTLAKYSRDFSIYQVRPLLVAMPADPEDLRKIICFAAQEGLTVTPRGGGSGTAGSALGSGIVVVLPRGGFWDEIAGFSIEEGLPQVEARAGVFHNDLQKYLRAREYFLPADVSSAKISCIGGNISTKASGPHALKHGSIDRFLVHLEFFTARGELVNTGDEATIPQEIRDKLENLKQRIRDDRDAEKLLVKRANLKTASGYNMFAFLKDYPAGMLLAQLLAGSVGTLGFITGATLRGEIYEPQRATMLISFEDLVEAGRAAVAIRDVGAAAIEILNRETIRVIRQKTGIDKKFAPDEHMLFVEFAGRGLSEHIEKAKKMLQFNGFRTTRPPVIATTTEEMEKLWELRKRILPLISKPAPGIEALSVVNDVGVDPRRLADCIADLQRVFNKHEIEAVIYGHAGSGNLHLRPFFDLNKPDLKGRIQRLADAVYEVIFRYGGTITAEHGMGRLRAPYLRPEWGERIYCYMKELKNIFDPQQVFNPGVMFSDRIITENLRPDLLHH